MRNISIFIFLLNAIFVINAMQKGQYLTEEKTETFHEITKWEDDESGLSLRKDLTSGAIESYLVLPNKTKHILGIFTNDEINYEIIFKARLELMDRQRKFAHKRVKRLLNDEN